MIGDSSGYRSMRRADPHDGHGWRQLAEIRSCQRFGTSRRVADLGQMKRMFALGNHLLYALSTITGSTTGAVQHRW